jgi:hypothetical protein
MQPTTGVLRTLSSTLIQPILEVSMDIGGTGSASGIQLGNMW